MASSKTDNAPAKAQHTPGTHVRTTRTFHRYLRKEKPMAQFDTWTGRTLGEASPEQWRALQAFASRHGRTWKATLREAWMSGHYPDGDHDDNGYLQQIRNSFGPRWLMLIGGPDFEMPNSAPAGAPAPATAPAPARTWSAPRDTNEQRS